MAFSSVRRLRLLLSWGQKYDASSYISLVLIAQLVAMVVVAWTIAQIWWKVATPESTPPPSAEQPQLSLQSKQAIAHHYFGEGDIHSPLNSTPPPASLYSRLRLLGTYVVADQKSSALLALDGGSNTLLVHIGQEIIGGQKITKIRPDGIELGDDTQTRKIYLRPTDFIESVVYPQSVSNTGSFNTQPFSDSKPLKKEPQ